MASLAPRARDGAMRPLARSLLAVVARLQRQSGLTDTERDALLALPAHMTVIERGDHLVQEGKATDSCCALLAGFACRHRSTGAGQRQILAIHMKGDLVDLQNAGLGTVDYGVQALTAVTVAYIPRRALLKLAAEHPAIAKALWTDALIDASITREWLMNLGRRNAYQRISHLLCELAVRKNHASLNDDGNFAVPLTQEQIGEVTGLTAVHVNRTIQRMRAEGFIRVAAQRMSIVDWPALVAAADFDRAYLHQPAGENGVPS